MNDANKIPLILLHGALGSKDQLEPLRLLFNDPKALSMNFSGHGGLPLAQAEYDILRFVDDVIALMDEQGMKKVNIFGYSMGGYVALKLAQLHPGRVNRIFTLGTKFDWTPESAAREVRQLDPQKLTEKVPQFARALELRHTPEDWKAVLSKTAKMMLELGNGAAMTEIDFKSIQHPIAIGIGTADVMVSLQESKTVAVALPNGRLEVFEGFKHPVEQVDVGHLCERVSAFFNA